MTNLEIGLVQINNSFSGASYFPYSVGLLQAYYEAHGTKKDNVEFLEPLFERDTVENAVQHLQGVALAAFSVYAWNFQISKAIAIALKKVSPETTILFGGPQVPRNPVLFLQENPFIDIVAQGEGERIFTLIVDRLESHNWQGLPAITYRDGSAIYSSDVFERSDDLESIPSPYLSGVFDALMAKYTDRQWLGLWETNRGCPFSCSFCDWGAPEQRKVHKFSLERARAELEWFAKNKIEFIFCCDSNFGMFERDVDLACYASELKERYGYPKALSVQNAKNATERIIRVQEELARAGLNKGVTLALQSATPLVLKSVRRKNISFQAFSDLQRHFTQSKIETYTDIILCLPEETYETFTSGIDKVIESGQFNRIQFINLSILPNSLLADPDYVEKYGLKTVSSNCVNIHGHRDAQGSILESQQLVIASKAMSESDWLQARAWSWMCSLLFFDKVLQIPLTLIAKEKKIPISQLIDAFLMCDQRYPIVSEISSFFYNGAKAVQMGGAEYHYSQEFLDIYWPHDEYCMVKLTAEDKWDDFYKESLSILMEAVGVDVNFGNILQQATALSRAMMKTPSQELTEVATDFPIWEYHQGIVAGNPIALENVPTVYHIDKVHDWSDLNDWARRVVWWGNKKALYWWPIKAI